MSQSFHPGLTAPYQYPAPSPSHLDMPMIFGAVTVGLMLICHFQQNRVPLLIIGCVVFGFMAGIYGFMVGAWPLGVAQIIYTVIAVRPWLDTHRRVRKPRRPSAEHRVINELYIESRMSRFYGSN